MTESKALLSHIQAARLGDQTRAALIRFIRERVTAESPAEEVVANDMLIPVYEQAGQYKVGDIRTDPETRQPFRCILAYDADVQTDWTLHTPTLWAPYHSTDVTAAYPWAEPTGAHDMYKAGEYMTYTDGMIYRCIADTNFSPEAYEQAWEKVPE